MKPLKPLIPAMRSEQVTQEIKHFCNLILVFVSIPHDINISAALCTRQLRFVVYCHLLRPDILIIFWMKPSHKVNTLAATFHQKVNICFANLRLFILMSTFYTHFLSKIPTKILAINVEWFKLFFL